MKLASDLLDKIRWIVRIAKLKDPGYTASKLVDPMIRAQVEAKYKLIELDVERIKKAEDSAAAKTDGE